MSWASEAVGAIRKVVLIEDRVVRIASQVNQLAETCRDLDRRLVRLEAKFDLIEKIATTSRKTFQGKPQTRTIKKETD